MAKRTVEESSLILVADSIRAKAGKSDKLEFPSGFKRAVDEMQVGGTEIKNQDITIKKNGTYTADEGYTGFGIVKVETEVAKNQDITITENGTYTPASGYTGFGSVKVEVESSGSGGGGTDGDALPDAGNVIFGYETVVESVETGRCTYGDIGPIMAFPSVHGYQIVQSNGGNISVLQTSVPLVYSTSWSYFIPSSVPMNWVQLAYDPTTGAWVEEFGPGTITDSNASFSARYGRFSTYDILKTNEDIYMAAGTPEMETTVTSVEKPLERDETYTIEGNTLNELVSLAQKVTGTNAPMTPEQAIEALDKYANPETTE